MQAEAAPDALCSKEKTSANMQKRRRLHHIHVRKQILSTCIPEQVFLGIYCMKMPNYRLMRGFEQKKKAAVID